MRVGGVRTSVELEAEFWACLAELAAARYSPAHSAARGREQ
jgi:predicted DNA-binding ribbon-helix-helix protein